MLIYLTDRIRHFALQSQRLKASGFPCFILEFSQYKSCSCKTLQLGSHTIYPYISNVNFDHVCIFSVIC